MSVYNKNEQTSSIKQTNTNEVLSLVTGSYFFLSYFFLIHAKESKSTINKFFKNHVQRIMVARLELYKMTIIIMNPNVLVIT